MALSLGLGIGAMWFKFRRQPKKEFCDARTPQPDDEFVAGCGVFGAEAKVAIGVRHVIAKLGDVEPHFIHYDDPFQGRIDLLRFWDSLDEVAIVLELENELGVRFSDDQAAKMRHPELTKDLTVRDYVNDVIKALPD